MSRRSLMDLKSKRILVTGGTGFLGRHVVERLKAKDCENVAVPESIDLTMESSALCALDIYQAGVVIHLAAKVGGIQANATNPGKYFYDNLMMGLNVLEACRLQSVDKLVVVGSVCAYPWFTRAPFHEADLWNGYPEETNAPYGIAKRALLTGCQAYRKQYGLNAIYLLLANLYGPTDCFDPERAHVIPSMIRKFGLAAGNGHEKVVLWGDGTPTRDFLFVRDAADGIIAAAELYDKPEPVNLGSGVETSIRALADKIANIAGYRGRIEWDMTWPNGQMRRCLNIARAAAEFGWSPKTSLDAGLSETYKWWLDNCADQYD